MIITLDGPAASGKSSLAQALAHRLSFYYINTGLLYRAYAYLHHENSCTLHDFKKHIERGRIQYFFDELGARIVFHEGNITSLLKTALNDVRASEISSNADVREIINWFQRYIARENHCVIDGRDCGTIVFPHAQYKFFVTASVQERARRWRLDQQRMNITISEEDAEKLIAERDFRDIHRAIAPLRQAADAHIIDTTELLFEQALELIQSYIKV
jgi:cytidylate kinase